MQISLLVISLDDVVVVVVAAVVEHDLYDVISSRFFTTAGVQFNKALFDFNMFNSIKHFYVNDQFNTIHFRLDTWFLRGYCFQRFAVKYSNSSYLCNLYCICLCECSCSCTLVGDITYCNLAECIHFGFCVITAVYFRCLVMPHYVTWHTYCSL